MNIFKKCYNFFLEKINCMMMLNRIMLYNGGNYVLCKDGEYNNGKFYFVILVNGFMDLIYKYKLSCLVDVSLFLENKDIYYISKFF